MKPVYAWSVTITEESAICDDSLLKAAQAGDKAAISHLLSPHQRALYVLCRGILGQTEDAEDAVQETFVRALRALPRFRPKAALQTWLFHIAIHVCLDRKRRRGDLYLQELSEVATALPSPAEAALTKVQIEQALAALMPRQRTLLLLREWHGWSIAEIADALHCTQRRVNNELYYVRRILKDWSQRQEQEGAEK